MPYALFCSDAKLSKAYPTEADVWKHARQCGLIVDIIEDETTHSARPVLDYDYEVKSCQPDPQESPEKNEADAEKDAQMEFQLNS